MVLWYLLKNLPKVLPQLRSIGNNFRKDMVLNVKIAYCGGWGYEPKFLKVKKSLEERFPGKIEVIGDKIPGVSGKFEVELEDGTMLHSKINGEGYVDTPAKLDKIAKGIETALG